MTPSKLLPWATNQFCPKCWNDRDHFTFKYEKLADYVTLYLLHGNN